jgi:hypothetical protein
MPDSGSFDLEWFLQQGTVRNAFLDESEWSHLYVRRGILVVYDEDWNQIQLDDVLHLANFEARTERSGTFTRLVERVEKVVPGLPIFVENLLNEGFAAKLPKMGFETVYTHDRWLGSFVGSWCFLKRYPHA